MFSGILLRAAPNRRSRLRAARRLWGCAFAALSALLLLGACEDDASSASAQPTNPPASEAPRSPSPEPGSPELRSPEPDVHMRVYLDLYRHLARAEIRQGRALLIDFGEPGAQKYTLGGWRTRVGEDRQLGGTSTTILPRALGELALPAETFGPLRLTLRARAPGDGRLTVYVGERSVGHARVPSAGFGVVSLTLDEGTLHPGENVLQLRVASVGRAEGERVGLALDWLRLEPAPEEAPEASSPTAPPTFREPEGRLRIPRGFSLGYALEVPPGARLRAEVRGAIRVRVHRDGVPPVVAAETRDGALDLDLRAWEGNVVRLDLEATSDASLVHPKVVEAAPPPPPSAPLRARNAIVFLVDTVRADKLSPWNPDTRVRTPGLDAWSAHGAVFARGATQENWTKPSVATLLSGLLPWQHTATSGEAVLPGSVELLSERLQEAGFHTGAFVCNGYVSRTFGFRQGWSTWRNYIRQGRQSHARFVAGDVLAWLDERPSDKPFFLYVHTIDPHVPYIPPPEILAEYDPEPYEGPVDFRRDRQLLEKIKIGRLHLGERDKRRLEALYDGEITYHDAHFASIVEGLERRGLADETVFVFTADHGEELFDHDSVGHGHSLFQELLHVPLVMRVPGAPGPLRVEEPVGLVDVAPTVLDVLGQDIPEGLAGRSVVPLLRGASFDAPRPAIAGFMEGWRSIWLGHRKLIQRTHRRWMLYDLARDPGETRDLSEERPLEVRYLRGLLGLALAGHAEPLHRAEATAIDDELDAQLRALGYVGTQRR